MVAVGDAQTVGRCLEHLLQKLQPGFCAGLIVADEGELEAQGKMSGSTSHWPERAGVSGWYKSGRSSALQGSFEPAGRGKSARPDWVTRSPIREFPLEIRSQGMVERWVPGRKVTGVIPKWLVPKWLTMVGVRERGLLSRVRLIASVDEPSHNDHTDPTRTYNRELQTSVAQCSGRYSGKRSLRANAFVRPAKRPAPDECVRGYGFLARLASHGRFLGGFAGFEGGVALVDFVPVHDVPPRVRYSGRRLLYFR